MPHHFLIEQLEPRQLLSAAMVPDSALAGPAAGMTPPGYLMPAAVSAAATTGHVDAAAVRDQLVRFADTWNGGQLGRLGTGGMDTYSPTWDGLFRMNLDRQFNRISAYTNDQTIISQSRAIYLNVEAYRNAPAADRARFKTAVQRGADYLLGKAVDPNTYNGKPGGMWWGLQSDGASPPTHTMQIAGAAPCDKHAYGQVQALFALAQAYTITGDADHLNGGFAQLDVWNTQFADAGAGPGAFLPTANEDYTQRTGARNLDYMTHALEALLALNDATSASDPRKGGLAAQITNIGNFITTRMYRDAPGSTTMGYLPWWYNARWNPSPDPAQQYSTPGHNFEVAFLLSRAVERGFDARWLDVANKLVAYSLRYSFDNVPTSPTYGAVLPEKLAFDGSRFDAAPDDLVWWQQSEAARALIHFAAVRGRADLWDEYDAAAAFIRGRFVDPLYGGWFTYLNPTTLAPTTTDKGTVWTGGYHETMLDAERLRVATASSVATFPAAADAYVRDGTYAGQTFGAAPELGVKRGSTAGYTRESYLRFSFIGMGDVAAAALRLFGRSNGAENVPVAIYGVTNTTWPEAGLTWSSKPATGTAALGTRTVAGTGGQWYEFDVTPYLRQQKAAGATAVTFAVRATATTGAVAQFNSDEAESGGPQLVIATQAEVPQAIVVSTGTVSVPEGGTAQLGVKLARQPAADVTVTVARQSGDADLTGTAALRFTASNWNTPQSVTIAAAADADSSNGSAVFAVTSAGLSTKLVTATEADDDATPVNLRAAADTYVRDGAYAAQNFGTATGLAVKRGSVSGYTRQTYLRFNLAGVASVGSARLRLYGSLGEAVSGGVAIQVYGTSNVSWPESGMTWNTRPAASTGVLASKTVVGTSGQWYEFDVTAYLRQQKAAGAAAVTLLLQAAVTSNALCTFASDEAAANRPQLVIT